MVELAGGNMDVALLHRVLYDIAFLVQILFAIGGSVSNLPTKAALFAQKFLFWRGK